MNDDFAFPQLISDMWGQKTIHGGLSIRDYFAAKALQGTCSTLDGASNIHWQIIACDSYKIADAMLKARETV